MISKRTQVHTLITVDVYGVLTSCTSYTSLIILFGLFNKKSNLNEMCVKHHLRYDTDQPPISLDLGTLFLRRNDGNRTHPIRGHPVVTMNLLDTFLAVFIILNKCGVKVKSYKN